MYEVHTHKHPGCEAGFKRGGHGLEDIHTGLNMIFNYVTQAC